MWRKFRNELIQVLTVACGAIFNIAQTVIDLLSALLLFVLCVAIPLPVGFILMRVSFNVNFRSFLNIVEPLRVLFNGHFKVHNIDVYYYYYELIFDCSLMPLHSFYQIYGIKQWISFRFFVYVRFADAFVHVVMDIFVDFFGR